MASIFLNTHLLKSTRPQALGERVSLWTLLRQRLDRLPGSVITMASRRLYPMSGYRTTIAGHNVFPQRDCGTEGFISPTQVMA